MDRFAGRSPGSNPAGRPGVWYWACSRTCPAGAAGERGVDPGTPATHCMQHLLCRAVRDADAVRDDGGEYVVERVHDDVSVLVVDETGDVKKGATPLGSSARGRHGRADRERPGSGLP